MKRGVNPSLVGAFVVASVVVLVLLLLSVGGQDLLKRKERAVMYFSGSIYGLQVGAPVVFRGVQVGTVASIDVRWDEGVANYVIPVVAELDASVLRKLGLSRPPAPASTRRAASSNVAATATATATASAPAAGLAASAPASGATDSASQPASRHVLAPLLQRGLRAQLGMQSLVTGQLYVDLDLRPGVPARVMGSDDDMPEIPTQDAAIQNLKNQLEGLDIRRLVQDITDTARSVRELAGGPDVRNGVRDAARAAADISRLAARLEAGIGPLAAATSRTLARTGVAVDQAGAAARRIEEAAGNAAVLLAPGSPLVQSLQTTADEVARSAAALRTATDSDGPLMQQTQDAARDVARAARAVRELALSLERHPEALIRGRNDGP